MSYRRLSTALLSAITLSIATAALAQFGQEQEPRPRIWVGGGGYGRMSRERPKFATRANFDGRFNFCRGYYSRSQEYFDRFSPNGCALGVNIMIYAMTH